MHLGAYLELKGIQKGLHRLRARQHKCYRGDAAPLGCVGEMQFTTPLATNAETPLAGCLQEFHYG